MRWFSVSKWMQQCVAPSVDRGNVFHSSSGELSDVPWSPSSCDHRSTSSFSSSSSGSGSASAGSGGRSFAKRLFSRMGRSGGGSERGSGKKEGYDYADGVTPEMSYLADQEDDFNDYCEEDLSHPSLWQKNILLGEKCEPLAFSGLILYDAAGNRINKLPAKSPLHPSLTGGPN